MSRSSRQIKVNVSVWERLRDMSVETKVPMSQIIGNFVLENDFVGAGRPVFKKKGKQ